MKKVSRLLSLLVIALCFNAHTMANTDSSTLPMVKVSKLGELIMNGDDFSYREWQSSQPVNKVHVIQYFPGTMSASKTFEPFTDLLQEQYKLGTYHVTTIINLDAAMWGTTGFVVSEVEKSKRKFPGSTMVLDKSGDAVDTWKLGKKGLGLFILDSQGHVQFEIRHKMSSDEQGQAAAVFADLMSQSQQAAAR